ncbi:Hypothetical protein CINCED_3A004845 [Cinara cedri]|uniref:Uncharacterized protein n=1 Tax=Cinara cedri TaxID=506608 RepID=A0A5E4ML94_9HEMI|nr:Hypothetical protein CINCED_3A004845 [Cinara cedri]
MNVKKYMVTVICKNIRDERQKGDQALLNVLHPHIKYFRSLLRLYSHKNVRSSNKKKLNEPGTQNPRLKESADPYNVMISYLIS